MFPTILGVTCTKSLEIRIYGVTVKLLRGMPPKVDNYTVTGNRYRTSGLTVTRSGLWIFVYSSRLKMTVQYDEGKKHYVSIYCMSNSLSVRVSSFPFHHVSSDVTLVSGTVHPLRISVHVLYSFAHAGETSQL